MTTILTRDQIDALWVRRQNGLDTPVSFEDSIYNFAAALESALLEKLCGEPRAWLVEGSRTFVDRAYMSEWTADQHVADRGSDGSRKVPLYTLKDTNHEDHR